VASSLPITSSVGFNFAHFPFSHYHRQFTMGASRFPGSHPHPSPLETETSQQRGQTFGASAANVASPLMDSFVKDTIKVEKEEPVDPEDDSINPAEILASLFKTDKEDDMQEQQPRASTGRNVVDLRSRLDMVSTMFKYEQEVTSPTSPPPPLSQMPSPLPLPSLAPSPSLTWQDIVQYEASEAPPPNLASLDVSYTASTLAAPFDQAVTKRLTTFESTEDNAFSSSDLQHIVDVLAERFRLFAANLPKIMSLTLEDRRALLEENIPAYVHFCLASFLVARSPARQRRWIGIVTDEEAVTLCVTLQALSTAVGGLFTADSGDVASYASLCARLAELTLDDGSTRWHGATRAWGDMPLATAALLFNRTRDYPLKEPRKVQAALDELLSLCNEEGAINRNKLESLLDVVAVLTRTFALKGSVRPSDAEDAEIRSILGGGGGGVPKGKGRQQQRSRSSSALAKHLTMPYTVEEEKWLQAQLIK